MFPGLTLKELPRQVRPDPDTTGNGWIEAFRNIDNQIAVPRYVPARIIRCVRLDAPSAVIKSRAV